MMRSLSRLALALVLVFSTASPVLAETATIDAWAPIADHSEHAIKAALVAALKAAIQQAEALGLTWVTITQAFVSEDKVTVQLLARDTDPGEGERKPGTPARLSL